MALVIISIEEPEIALKSFSSFDKDIDSVKFGSIISFSGRASYSGSTRYSSLRLVKGGEEIKLPWYASFALRESLR